MRCLEEEDVTNVAPATSHASVQLFMTSVMCTEKKATGKHVAIQKEKVVDTADFETEARIHMIEVTVEITENRSTPKIFKKKRYRVLIPSMKQMEKCTRKLSILSQLVQQMHG